MRLYGWYNLGNEAISNRTPEAEAVDSEGIKAFQEIIDRSRRIVFFGGAGVSTASGIPDFRSANGMYAEETDSLSPEMILSKSFFYLQPEKFFDYYRKHMLYPDITVPQIQYPKFPIF